ncbi:uncharacterized protein N7500_009469 [Penicillium coprophilum]|uniref:uncharacterized protein n=1 Tax=Penicillium coprophilum TaxID=36646 RepID=UPI002390B103|nr:uncharacterized protein N7500_009469 [Penicillium coprophilum]KAJ5154030.1 hypothetical protein N7500_009469 [Penicillium coprophilum]
MASNQDQDINPMMSAAMSAGLQPPYQVDTDGDVVLFTPKTPLIDISKGNVPGNYARFQVSSKHLALSSAYFKRMLKDRWAEGEALRTNGSAEIPVNDCKPDILLIILNLIHGQLRQVPLRLSLQQLSDIAVATDFFQCHEVVEVFAGIWIKDLWWPLSIPGWSPFSLSLEDMRTWLMISCVFKSPDVFEATTRTAMRKGTGPFDTSYLPIPKSVKDAIDQARQKCIEKFEVMIKKHILNLLNGPICCSGKCDATQLGHLLSRMTKEKIFYSLDTACTSESDHVPSITVSICELSPDFIYTMITEWEMDVPCRPASRCFNKANPLGDEGELRATQIYQELTGLEDLSLTS